MLACVVILQVCLGVLFTLLLLSVIIRPVEAKEPIKLKVESVANPDLDLSTACSQANQFGLIQLSTVYFEDGNTAEITNKYVKVDNTSGRGHFMNLYPSGYLEGWFDTKNRAVYANFGNGDDIVSDWFLTTIGEHDDVLTQSLGNSMDYNKTVEFLHSTIEDAKGKFVVKAKTDAGIWYETYGCKTMPSSVGLTPSRSTLRVFVPYSNAYVTQIDIVLYYEDNVVGAEYEVYEFDIEFDVDYCCEVPAKVTGAVGDYNTQLKLYHNMMR